MQEAFKNFQKICEEYKKGKEKTPENRYIPYLGFFERWVYDKAKNEKDLPMYFTRLCVKRFSSVYSNRSLPKIGDIRRAMRACNCTLEDICEFAYLIFGKITHEEKKKYFKVKKKDDDVIAMLQGLSQTGLDIKYVIKRFKEFNIFPVSDRDIKTLTFAQAMGIKETEIEEIKKWENKGLTVHDYYIGKKYNLSIDDIYEWMDDTGYSADILTFYLDKGISLKKAIDMINKRLTPDSKPFAKI